MANYTKGQMWGGLRKAWTGYRIAKVQNDEVRMKEYAEKIRALQGQLGLLLSKFPDLDLS